MSLIVASYHFIRICVMNVRFVSMPSLIISSSSLISVAKCEPPPIISNGRHNGGDEDFYTYGSSVTYSCDPEFSMLGQASISCRVENKTIGVWSPSPPSCKSKS